MTPTEIEALRARWTGKRGPRDEAEASILDCDVDDLVAVHTTGRYAIQILDRCGSAVRRVEELGGGDGVLALFIERSAYRGLHMAFKPIDIESEPMSAEDKAGLVERAGR